jgi:divinyl protochlorophyllide a 8-vinyl-reductase
MSDPSRSCTEPARIGPNAVIQLGETLAAHGEDRLAGEIYLAAGCPDWLARPPQAMVEEDAVVRLHRALWRLAAREQAAAYAREAGMRTGDYILANRIPAPARMLLRLMPAPIAARLLVEAISAHAWTFAGSGRFSAQAGTPVIVEIADNPLAGPEGCVWHTAVFRRLFQSLVHAESDVRETACCGAGAPACRFEIAWKPTEVVRDPAGHAALVV